MTRRKKRTSYKYSGRDPRKLIRRVKDKLLETRANLLQCRAITSYDVIKNPMKIIFLKKKR